MFTILPSLYLVAVHYIRQWNRPYYYEQSNDEANENQSKKISSNKDQIDENLLQIAESRSENSSSSTKKNLSRSSLLNVDRCKTYTGDLQETDIVYLMNETDFTREQIIKWRQDFLRDCPDGKLSKSKFNDIYKQFYTKGQVEKFCEHAFRVFDKDSSGFIDFVEFLLAVSMTSTKDASRKIELFFSMYDIDQNGLIDENEMRCVVESIYELMGIDIRDQTRIDVKVREIFAKAKCDESGFLTKDQFAAACSNDRHIRKLLVPNTKKLST